MDNVKMQPKKVIKCPHCGWEYLPGEIFYPDNAIGQPVNIVRDSLGHIIYEEYLENKEPLAEEEFWCEHCEKPFVAEIELTVKAKPQTAELDFSETSVELF